MQFKFGDFVLDPVSGELSRDGQPVAMEPQVFKVLVCLVENRDRVVSKDDLIDAVWNGRIISDATLNSRINSVRRALGDDGKKQALVRTLTRRGFRFVAQIEDAAVPNRTASRNPVQKPSIAILPLKNLSNDSEQDYFADGIAEDIIAALSRVRTLFVIARGSSFAYRDRSADVRDIADKLNARYIVDGSVRKSSNRVRVAIQLIDGGTGTQLWSERYDRKLTDIFDVQDEITSAIVGALQPELGKAEQERAKLNRTESLDAWTAFQQGMWNTNRRTPQSLRSAVECFGRSMELDPTSAAPCWGATIAYFYLLLFGWAEQRNKALNEILTYAQRAVSLDPEDSMSHTAMGYAYCVRRDPDSGIPELLTAIDMDPNNYLAPRMLGITLTGAGRAQEALPHLRRSLQLSPRDPLIGGTLSWTALAHFFLDEAEQAVEYARKGYRLRQAPQTWTVTTFISILSHLGRQEEARTVCAELLSSQPNIDCKFVRDNIPIAPSKNLDSYVEGLRKAGLP